MLSLVLSLALSLALSERSANAQRTLSERSASVLQMGCWEPELRGGERSLSTRWPSAGAPGWVPARGQQKDGRV